MRESYLPGLNSLRFFAALFVIISHGNISLLKLNIIQNGNLTFLNRGGEAVEFFFTLSGFLITYLLINENNKNGFISIKKFYLRRVYRIWPLYFLVTFIGFILLGFIYPFLYKKNYFNFPILEGFILFLLFLPNYVARNYQVGLLNPLWSIGVEEQFYLFWAPLIKIFNRNIHFIIYAFLILSILFFGLVFYDVFKFNLLLQNFLLSQKFYAMAIGGLFGYIYFFKLNLYTNSFFSSKLFQFILLCCVFWYYMIGFGFEYLFVFRVIICFLYGLLILNISVIKNKLIDLETPWLNYLGAISYGLYMLHMLVDYVLRLIVEAFLINNLPKLFLIGFYYSTLTLATIAIASLSYYYFEKPFLKLKNKAY